MSLKFRNYDSKKDYNKINNFLIRTFNDYFHINNWMQPRWEYMNYHPYIKKLDITKIGIWEDKNKIAGIVNPEHGLGVVYFQIDPEYNFLSEEMINYAEENLFRIKNKQKEL